MQCLLAIDLISKYFKNEEYKEITYYETVQRMRSSTPMDELDNYIVIENFVEEKDALRLKQEEDSKLLIKIRENPKYPNTHINYIVRKQTLRLRKSFD